MFAKKEKKKIILSFDAANTFDSFGNVYFKKKKTIIRILFLMNPNTWKKTNLNFIHFFLSQE